MRKASTRLRFVCTIALVFFQSCEQESDAEFQSQTELYKNAQLANIYDNEVAVLASSLTKETQLLEQATKTFRTNGTTADLKSAQEQWKAVQSVWKRLELYDLGAVANSFIAFEINRWPTDIERIEGHINGSEVLNEDFIASLGSSSKGIAAAEHLLFSVQDHILDASSTYLQRRNEYLLAVVENLHSKALQLQTLWETHAVGFVQALENGINGSQNQVINAMVSLIEEIIISKLGNPLGDTNGGTIVPERLEARLSAFSKEIVQQHLTALKRCYTGDFALTPFRVGFDDFLILIGSEKLSDKISDQFAVCQTKLNDIEGSLEDALVSNPESVLALKYAFRDLLVLVKVDMANVLGSTITFNDNDGD